ncbi:integral membrane protein [Paraphaeosphaeria sporulosa]
MIENRGPQLQGVVLWMVSMAFVATVLRVYVRIRLVKAFGWDDAWMVFAMLVHIMFATCAIAGVHHGTGRHFKDLSPEGIYKALRYWWLCYIAYCLTMIGAKISIGLFLLRITPKKIHHWIIYTILGLTVLTGIVFLSVTIFQCTPISYFWYQALGAEGSCINIYVIIGLTYLYSVISALCDFTYGLLPVVLVWNLNMSKTLKIALIPILSMACVASIAVIVRMGFVMKFVTNDFLYDTVDIAIWSDIEQGLAITAGSLATLRPLYRLVSDRLGWATRASSNGLKAMSPYDRSGFSNHNKRKRSGPFSTLFNQGGKEDEEYGLENCKPVKLEEHVTDKRGSQFGHTVFSREKPSAAS